MRACLLVLPVMLGACQDRGPSPAPSAAPNFSRESTPGETRARIAEAKLRSGPAVPVVLPPGFSLYPGATVVRNTQVERGRERRVLVEFETPDPIAKVLLFHRAQAQAAGVTLTLDLDGSDAASIGGQTASGGEFALTARRVGNGTVVELSISNSVGPDD